MTSFKSISSKVFNITYLNFLFEKKIVVKPRTWKILAC